MEYKLEMFKGYFKLFFLTKKAKTRLGISLIPKIMVKFLF